MRAPHGAGGRDGTSSISESGSKVKDRKNAPLRRRARGRSARRAERRVPVEQVELQPALEHRDASRARVALMRDEEQARIVLERAARPEVTERGPDSGPGTL